MTDEFMGIDPGKNGALAIIHSDGAEAWHYPGDVALAVDLVRSVLLTQRPVLAAIEKVGARPGQGVTSMFNFGANYGQWIGILAALGVPYVMVLPQTWQKVALDSGGGSAKDRSLAWARRRFPDVDLSLKKDDGKADALGLAVYARHIACDEWWKKG